LGKLGAIANPLYPNSTMPKDPGATPSITAGGGATISAFFNHLSGPELPK
jgi:hypothetical protein